MADQVLVLNDAPANSQQALVTPQGFIQARLRPYTAPAVGGLNRAYGVQGTATPPANNDATAILALASIKVRGSGIFLASVTVAYTAPTPDAPENLTWTVQTDTGPGTVVLTNATKFGPAAPTSAAGEGAFVSSNVAGIGVTTGGGDQLTQFQGTSSLNANTLHGIFQWTGVIQSNADDPTETPFDPDTNVLLELLSPGSTVNNTMTFDVAISLVEL